MGASGVKLLTGVVVGAAAGWLVVSTAGGLGDASPLSNGCDRSSLPWPPRSRCFA